MGKNEGVKKTGHKQELLCPKTRSACFGRAYAPALSREVSPYGEGDGFAASQAASDAAHEVVKAVGGVDEESAEAVSAYGDAAVAEGEGAVAGADDGSPGQGGHRRGTDAEALTRLHAVVVHHGLQPNALQSRLGQGRGRIVQWCEGVKGKKKTRQANAGDGKLLETFVELFGGQEKLFGRFWRK